MPVRCRPTVLFPGIIPSIDIFKRSFFSTRARATELFSAS